MLQYLTFNTNHCGSDAFDNDETRRKYSRRVVRYGQEVDWLEDRHYTVDTLEKYRLIGDHEMDQILNLSSGKISISGAFSNTVDACEKIYHEQKKNGKQMDNISNEDLAMLQFYEHYHDRIPPWVDFQQIQRGIDVFITYAPVAGQALFYLSLVPGFSIPKIAKVLEQTRYLVPPSTPEQVRNRLMDTGGFISNTMLPGNDGLSAASLRPGSKGWKMALQVRVLHAKVRRSILRNKRISWDTNKYGVPINQEDMAATLLAFSVNVLMGIRFISGRELSLNEQKDYLALWRYIGWLLGVECDENGADLAISSLKTDCNPLPMDPCGTRMYSRKGDDSVIHARACLESIILHLMQPDESSSRTAMHLLSIGGSRLENHASQNSKGTGDSIMLLYRLYMCRRFIGTPLADALKLPKPNYHLKSILAYTLTTFILVIFRIYTLLTMSSRWFRNKAYARHLRLTEGFVKVWGENNSQRMQEKADQDINKTQSLSSRKNIKKATPCPFSLVMPPTPEKRITHSKIA